MPPGSAPWFWPVQRLFDVMVVSQGPYGPSDVMTVTIVCCPPWLMRTSESPFARSSVKMRCACSWTVTRIGEPAPPCRYEYDEAKVSCCVIDPVQLLHLLPTLSQARAALRKSSLCNGGGSVLLFAPPLCPTKARSMRKSVL